MSPYIFILCAEVLAIGIRQNGKIKGISIGENEYKINQYADDTCLTINASKECLEEVIRLFEVFETFSGLKVNYDKTEIMPIGSIKNKSFKFDTIKKMKWNDGPVMLLGIKLCPDENEVIRINYTPLMQKIKSQLNIWSQRNITLYGKITIIKTFALSQLVYVMSVLPSPPNFKARKKRDKLD